MVVVDYSVYMVGFLALSATTSRWTTFPKQPAVTVPFSPSHRYTASQPLIGQGETRSFIVGE